MRIGAKYLYYCSVCKTSECWKMTYQNVFNFQQRLLFAHSSNHRCNSGIGSRTLVKINFPNYYEIIKIWRHFFFVTWYDRSASFPNCNEKWRITSKKCSWQEFKHSILGLVFYELAFQVFESRILYRVLIGILRCPYLLCEYFLFVRLASRFSEM